MKHASALSEDTKPHQAVGQVARPVPARGRGSRRRRRWPLIGILLVTSCTLAMTVMLLILSVSDDFLSDIALTTGVSIVQSGSILQAQTRAKTVGELLQELEITVPTDAALSHAMNEALVDEMTVSIKSARDVTITLDGIETRIHTPLDNPAQILESAEIQVGADDRITVNGALASVDALRNWTLPAGHIEIRRAIRLTIIDDGRETSIVTTAETVGAALREGGITLRQNDNADPPLHATLDGDVVITIDRAIPVAIRLDGVTIEARANAQNVAEVLLEMNAPLFGLDYVIPSGDSPVSKDMFIEIVRVTEEVIAQPETIPYDVRYQADAGMNLDQRAVVQAGRHGTRETRSRARYENGVEISRELTETVVTEPPQNQLIHYGTNIDLRTVDTPQGPRLYWRRLCMLATSYHPAALGGDDKTAIGWTLRKGVVASDPKLIRYETEVFVPGYGTGAMADTGGPRSSPYWIDLGYSDDDWKSWRRYVKVYLLTPVPPKIDYLLPAWTPIRSVAGGCNN